MVIYSGVLEQWPPFILSAVALLMIITSNISFYIIYQKDILKDQGFKKWLILYPKT